MAVMDIWSSHYSGGFNVGHMQKRARSLAQRLIPFYNERYAIVLVYSGMSGTNHATHLAVALLGMQISFSQVYVRKVGETSHGKRIESSDLSFTFVDKRCYVFVDDFIDSGKTLHWILKSMSEKRLLGTDSDILVPILFTQDSTPVILSSASYDKNGYLPVNAIHAALNTAFEGELQ